MTTERVQTRTEIYVINQALRESVLLYNCNIVD